MDVTSRNTSALVGFFGACGVVLALFALAAHPRFLARFLAGPQAGELWKGWTLRRGVNAGRRRGRHEVVEEHQWERNEKELEAGYDNKLGPFGFATPIPLSSASPLPLYTSSSNVNLPHSTSFTRSNSSSSQSSHLKPTTTSRSPHLPLYFPSLLPTVFTLPLPACFDRWAGINLTIGQVFVLLAYGTLVSLATFWYSAPGTDPTRSGLIATAQIPLVIALGTKNSVVSALLGKGSEKFNYLHRFLGRSIFIASTLHVAPYLHKYAIADDFVVQLGKPLISTGCFAYIALILISVSSIPVIRRKAFQFFQLSHWIGMVILLVSLSLHVPVCLPFTLSSASLYALDLLSRLLFKTHNPLTPALLIPLSDGVTTLVEIPSLTTGWRAGQHVFLRILHPGMGLGNMWESHPFTIASGGSEEEGEPLRLFVKRVPGGWTERLYGFANEGDIGTGEDRMKSGGAGGGRKCRVGIDGPYGGTGNTLFSSFSSILLVSGGSGITFSLAQALSLQARALHQGLVRARSVDLVWIVQSEASLQAFMPYLAPLLLCSSSSTNNKLKPFHLSSTGASNYKALKINLHIYITRPSASFTYDPTTLFSLQHPRLHIHTGRPNLHEIINAKVDEAAKEARRFEGKDVNPCGVGIGACGPNGLVRSLRNVVGGLEGGRMNEVGGVELVSETFGV